VINSTQQDGRRIGGLDAPAAGHDRLSVDGLSGVEVVHGPKTPVFAGRSRTGSFNARWRACGLALAGAGVTRISLEDYPLPLYDGDLSRVRHAGGRSGPADGGRASGVFIASPEYTASITPLLKHHRLDRARRRGEPPTRVQGPPTPGGSRFRVRRGAFADGAAAGAGSLRRAGDPGRSRCSAPAGFDEMDNLTEERGANALAVLQRLVDTAGRWRDIGRSLRLRGGRRSAVRN
jgi:NAD(P)H-dependent FMN reductase